MFCFVMSPPLGALGWLWYFLVIFIGFWHTWTNEFTLNILLDAIIYCREDCFPTVGLLLSASCNTSAPPFTVSEPSNQGK